MAAAADQDERNAAIHAALERHDGNRIRAGAELGISEEVLKQRIRNSPDLRERWGKVDMEPPDEIDGISRPALDTDKADRLAQAVAEENRKFQKGLEELGLDQQEIKYTMGLQAFSRGHFATVLDILTAGLTRSNIKSGMLLDRILERLEFVRGELSQDIPIDMREIYVKEEKGLLDAYASLQEGMRKSAATAQDGAIRMAMVRQKAKGGSGAKKAKPGFSPAGTVVDV